MKVGIITFHYPVNYGAVLQAYALSFYVKSLGHEVVFINYIPRDLDDPGAKRLRGNLKNFLQEQYIQLVARYTGHKLVGKFESFQSEYLPVGERVYRSLDELKKDPPVCDAYLCGSDQIWNPHGQAFDPAYFLKFGAPGIRRISYAASFGTPVIPVYLLESLTDNLRGLDHVSVREKSGVDIVGRVSEGACTYVVDPTLLLDTYPCSIAPRHTKEGYVFVYRLQQSHALTKSLTGVVKRVSARLSKQVVSVSPHRYRFFLETGKTVYPHPGEWVGLIEHASFVVTNSFHGTVFAIINRKPFISFPRVDEAGQNGRMQELLADLGLEKRFIIPKNLSREQINSLVEDEIDWGDVELRLSRLRQESCSFLTQALR